MKKRIQPRKNYDLEIAQLTAVLRALPIEVVRVITLGQLRTAFKLTIPRQMSFQVRRKFVEAYTGAENPVGDATGLAVLERLARIATKTYAHRGDDEGIASEDALRLILAELKRFDPSLISRNETRKPQRI